MDSQADRSYYVLLQRHNNFDKTKLNINENTIVNELQFQIYPNSTKNSENQTRNEKEVISCKLDDLITESIFI